MRELEVLQAVIWDKITLIRCKRILRWPHQCSTIPFLHKYGPKIEEPNLFKNKFDMSVSFAFRICSKKVNRKKSFFLRSPLSFTLSDPDQFRFGVYRKPYLRIRCNRALPEYRHSARIQPGLSARIQYCVFMTLIRKL